ncbi:MAG: putative glycoside hydrolase [Spirochaetes bacterium]|nr:putative glycoside hydrolase [Spirochaetota bacterium]
MKKICFILGIVLLFAAAFVAFERDIFSQATKAVVNKQIEATQVKAYSYPEFYRGIYLNVASGRDIVKLKQYIEAAKASKINTIVIDVQIGTSYTCQIPAENVTFCLENGMHPVARVVVFADGLSHWPVDPSVIANRLSVAEDACRKGFKEIQFDYIRFTDYTVRGKVPLHERYAFIEGFLARAREHLKQYNVKIAADIFGRVPLNTNDHIGQRIEGLDKVVDILCPMAYPSHYTWSKKLMADPYYTVYLTSKRARERVKKAEIVTYIQAFQMKIGLSGLSFDKYVEAQIKAVHDANVRGYILWNARNDYRVPLAAIRNYYSDTSRISKANKSQQDDETL